MVDRGYRIVHSFHQQFLPVMSTLYLKMSSLLPNSSFSFIFLYFIKVIYITVFNYLGQLNLMPIHRPFFVFCNKHRIFETDHGKKYLTIFKFLLFVFCYWHSNGHFGGIRIPDLRTPYHYWFTPRPPKFLYMWQTNWLICKIHLCMFENQS